MLPAHRASREILFGRYQPGTEQVEPSGFVVVVGGRGDEQTFDRGELSPTGVNHSCSRCDSSILALALRYSVNAAFTFRCESSVSAGVSVSMCAVASTSI